VQGNERRRVVLATAFTLVALPAIWVFERGDASGPSTPSVAAAGVPEPAAGSGGEGSTTTAAPEVPVFLDGGAPVAGPAVIDIARPGVGPDEARARATFVRHQGATVPRPCTTALARAGATITVTNVDNGLSTTCVNTLGYPIPVGSDIVIHTDVFVQIADLVDAPVPVRLSW